MVQSYLKYHYCGNAGTICSPDSNACFSSDGKSVFTGTNETISKWNPRTSQLEMTCRIDTEYPEPPFIHQVAFLCRHPSKQDTLAVGYSNGAVYLWSTAPEQTKETPYGLGTNLPNGYPIISFRGHTSAISAITFNKDGTRLATGGNDTDIVIWDTLSEAGLFRLQAHSNAITSLRFLSDDYLLSASKDATLRVWHLPTQSCVQVVVDNVHEIYATSISTSSPSSLPHLFVAGSSHQIRVYEVDLTEEGKKENRILVSLGSISRPWEGSTRVTHLEVLQESSSPSSPSMLVASTSGKSLEIYRYLSSTQEQQKKRKRRMRRIKEKQAKKRNQEEVGEMGEVGEGEEGEEGEETEVISANDILAPITQLKTIAKIRSMQCHVHKILLTFENNFLQVFDLSLSSLLSFEGTHQQGDIHFSTSSPLSLLSSLQSSGHTLPPKRVILSKDSALIFSLTPNSLLIFNTKTLKTIRHLSSTTSPLLSFSILDSEHILLGHQNGHIDLYNFLNDQITQTFSPFSPTSGSSSPEVLDIITHPSGKGFFTIHKNKTLVVWKTVADPSETPEILMEKTLPDVPTSISLSPISLRHLYVSLLNNTTVIYHMDSLKEYLTLYGHSLPVLRADVSADENLIATASQDKTIKIWNNQFGNCLGTLRGHKEAVTSLQWLPETHLLLSSSLDGTVRLWDVDKRVLICRFDGHASGVMDAAVGVDGGFFVSVGKDRALRVWRRTQEHLFLQDEREREMERSIEEDVLREDREERREVRDGREASRKTVESVRTVENLMQVIDDCEQAFQDEIEYRQKLKKWRENRDNKLTSVMMGSEVDNPPPVPPQPRFQMQGKTSHQFLMHSLRHLPARFVGEVVLSLPFAYAFKLLTFITNSLEIYRDAQGKGAKGEKEGEMMGGYYLEIPAKLALALVEMHMHQLRTHSSFREVLLRLRKVLQPAIQKELKLVQRSTVAYQVIAKMVERNSEAFLD